MTSLSQQGRPGAVPAAVSLVVLLTWLGVALGRRDGFLGEPDLWWHVKTGEWMWDHLAFPTTDPFSHSFAGQPWIAKEWLSQAIFFAVHHVADWRGVVVLGLAAFAIGVLSFYRVLARDLAPVPAGIACLAGLLLASPSFTLRPHLFTLPLLVLWTYHVFAAGRQGRAPHFAWLLLLVLWANLHAAFTLGFVIAGFAFLDFLERTRLSQRKALAQWLVFLLLCPLATLIHPYGWNAMLATFSVVVSNEAVALIGEWQPFNAQVNVVHEVALLLFLFGAMVSGVRIELAKALLLVLLFHLYLTHIRYGFYLFPLLMVLVAPEITAHFGRISMAGWLSQPRDPLERAVIRFHREVTGALCLAVAAIFTLQATVLRAAAPDVVAIPGAMRFVKEHGVSGNVMNQYGFGGPLIFHGIPTFIDGRTDQLFLGGFTKQFAKGPDNQADLEAAIARYAIRWAIFPPKDPRLALFAKLPGWKQTYADDVSVIYQREVSASPSGPDR